MQSHLTAAKKKESSFSIGELLVVMAMISMTAGFVLVNHPSRTTRG